MRIRQLMRLTVMKVFVNSHHRLVWKIFNNFKVNDSWWMTMVDARVWSLVIFHPRFTRALEVYSPSRFTTTRFPRWRWGTVSNFSVPNSASPMAKIRHTPLSSVSTYHGCLPKNTFTKKIWNPVFCCYFSACPLGFLLIEQYLNWKFLL